MRRNLTSLLPGRNPFRICSVYHIPFTCPGIMPFHMGKMIRHLNIKRFGLWTYYKNIQHWNVSMCNNFCHLISARKVSPFSLRWYWYLVFSRNITWVRFINFWRFKHLLKACTIHYTRERKCFPFQHPHSEYKNINSKDLDYAHLMLDE